jgi:hypothetical protein
MLKATFDLIASFYPRLEQIGFGSTLSRRAKALRFSRRNAVTRKMAHSLL